MIKSNIPASIQGPTRLHSSRMHTARALTVSPSMLCAGGCTWSGRGLPGLGGVYLVWGGVPGLGVYLVRYSPLLTE